MKSSLALVLVVGLLLGLSIGLWIGQSHANKQIAQHQLRIKEWSAMMEQRLEHLETQIQSHR